MHDIAPNTPPATVDGQRSVEKRPRAGENTTPTHVAGTRSSNWRGGLAVRLARLCAITIRAWSRRGRPDVRARGPRQRQLFEPGNEVNNERGERGDNVGEQLLLSQPPARRLLLLSGPERTGLALFDLPDAQTFELTAPSAPLSPSCHLAHHCVCSQCRKSSLAVKGDVWGGLPAPSCAIIEQGLFVTF